MDQLKTEQNNINIYKNIKTATSPSSIGLILVPQYKKNQKVVVQSFISEKKMVPELKVPSHILLMISN